MKKFILLSLIALFFGSLSAQTARKVSFEINKGTNVQGYTIDFSGEKSDKVISAAFQEMLEKFYGLKSTKSDVAKGFTNYVNQTLSPIDNHPLSVYFRVATEGKKNEKVTRLYFVVFDSGQNPVRDSWIADYEPKVFQFLNSFPAVLSDYENNLKLKETQNLLEKLKKDQEKLRKEKASLEKDLVNKENEIVSKDKEIQNAETELNRIQNLLKKDVAP